MVPKNARVFYTIFLGGSQINPQDLRKKIRGNKPNFCFFSVPKKANGLHPENGRKCCAGFGRSFSEKLAVAGPAMLFECFFFLNEDKNA